MKQIAVYFKRRAFERNLEILFNCCRGHQANGLSAGSPEYRMLLEKASEQITVFSKATGQPVESIQAQIPTLKKLTELAQAPAPAAAPVRLLALITAAAAAVFSLGILAGLFQAGLHVATRLFGG